MLWLQQNWSWLAPTVLYVASEAIAHSRLNSNSVIQALLAAAKTAFSKKAP